MAASNSTSILDRVQRAGCWAVGLYAFAAFFALGGLISMLNADIIRAVEGFVLAALSVAGGIWLARRAAQGPRDQTPPAAPAPKRASQRKR